MNIFAGDAVSLIYQVSKGTPRLINIICDHALLTGFSQGEPVIKAPIIKECIKELHFPGEVTPLPLPVALKENSNWPISPRYCLYALLGVAVFFILAEIFPATRSFSPLKVIFPQNMLEFLHQLPGVLGG